MRVCRVFRFAVFTLAVFLFSVSAAFASFAPQGDSQIKSIIGGAGPTGLSANVLTGAQTNMVDVTQEPVGQRIGEILESDHVVATGNVLPAYYEGYIWLTSHTNGGTYSYAVGPSIRVDSYATDPDDWGYYLMGVSLYDKQTETVIATYLSSQYVNYSKSDYANVLTGGLAVVSGRYQIMAFLWDDWSGYIQDYEYFNVNFVPDTVYSTIDSVRANGTTLTFSGHASDSVGHPINAYQWRSSIDGVIGYGASGTAVLSAGTHTIYFKSHCTGGVWSAEDSFVITVTKPVDRVYSTIDGVSASGLTLAFAGHASDSLGHAINAYQWRSSIDGIIGYSASGTAVLSAGTHTIYFKAHCAGGVWSAEDSFVISVTRPDLVASYIDAVTPNPGMVDHSISFQGHMVDSYGHAVAAYQWRSSVDGILSTNRTFSTTGLSEGTHTIYFKSKCSNNKWSPEVSSIVTVAPMDHIHPTLTTVAGTTRIATAIAASKLAFDTATHVVVATASNWPDALGGSALAGALDAPILLTSSTSLPADVSAEISRLGATEVIILGGPGAVSADVYTAIDSKPGVSVERIAGGSRYETASMTAARTIAELEAGVGYDGTAFCATGGNFPDALGASPLAAAKGWPIYLVNPTAGDNEALSSTMLDAGVTKAIVLGGTGAVSDSVEMQMGSTLGAVIRIAGTSRYTTALNVANYGVDNAGLGYNQFAVATGQNFPDALAGGVMQARSNSILLLTPASSLDPSVRSALTANKASITGYRVLGGIGAVSSTVREQVLAAVHQ